VLLHHTKLGDEQGKKGRSERRLRRKIRGGVPSKYYEAYPYIYRLKGARGKR